MLLDSTNLFSHYSHPSGDDVGDGIYVMFRKEGQVSWCPSGNELARIYRLDPDAWMTGPIYLALSPADSRRIHTHFESLTNNF